MSDDEKVRATLCEFYERCGIYPNTIIIGYRLSDELLEQFYYDTIPTRELKAVAEERNLCVRYEYEGIPVKIDYDNPDLLEVGYMVKWMENKY